MYKVKDVDEVEGWGAAVVKPRAVLQAVAAYRAALQVWQLKAALQWGGSWGSCAEVDAAGGAAL